MEHGDLGTWVDNGIIVVLEGFLAQIPPPEQIGRFRKKHLVWAPPERWAWSRHGMKVVNDRAHRMSLPIEVATFLSEDVAESAAIWLDKYAVAVSSVAYYEFDLFCESLSWRPNVQSVVDVEPARLAHYGIRGYQATWGGEF